MWTFALSESLRRATLGYHRSIIYRPRYSGPAPDRLLIAPTDLRTSDATLAHDFAAGRFVFAGAAIDADGESVFTVDPPNEEWARELHGFGWLRHLRASELTASRSSAHALVQEWIQLGARHHPIARQPEVVARRVLSWLSQSPLVLEDCDHAFYRKFIRSLTAQIRTLRRIAPDGPPGLPRLTMMIALAAAAVALPEQDRFLRQVGRWLDAELKLQILPDGGHVSRSPAAMLEVLADLLPLRQAYAARGLPPPPDMIAAIDRMMPMVRFFRHGDGAFARFNGTGDVAVDLVATVLAYDDARGAPLVSAPHSGYERLAHGDSVVLFDTGRPAPIGLSGDAHAGALSFEFSSRANRIIVNCGNGRASSARLQRLSRTTAAHSTVAVNDCSSCRFLMGSALARRFGEVIVEGPQSTNVARAEDDDGSSVLVASHDGYVERFGLVHERRAKLSPSGHRFDGIDRLLASGGGRMSRGAKNEFAIRFHLHPDVTPKQTDPKQVTLTLKNGEIWQFTSDHDVSLEESLFFSEIYGNLWSTQLVLEGRPQVRDTVAWSMQRTGMPTRQRGD